jgi:hypothetical protein
MMTRKHDGFAKEREGTRAHENYQGAVPCEEGACLFCGFACFFFLKKMDKKNNN